MLNNKGAESIQANPTFYSLAGTRLQIDPIIVPAASYIEVDMRQLLLNAGDEFREGSLNISYQGGPLQLGAQVRLVDQQHELIWAEQMVYTTKFLSSRLENVWWLPTESAETRLVVSNTSSSTLTTTIKVEGTSPAQSAPTQISLNPWETRVIDIMRDLVGTTTGNLLTKGGISISHTGTPGAVLARMYVAKPSVGYSGSFNFVDPQTAASSKWNGNGFRIRNLDGSQLGSVLVARNTSDQTTHLRGRIPFTRSNGEMDAVLIPAVSIGARSSKSVNLGSLIGNANVRAEVSVAGIELEYDTAPGTVITAVQSVSSDGQHVFQVPMMDPQNIPSSAGGFPWKADGDFHTFVYIKNETSVTRKYIAYLLYNGGGYSTGVKELRAGESAAIDFRDLRDNQVPDPSGRLIPLDVSTGQIAWSVVGSENKVLTGRSEQISLSNGVASTYACYNPCGNTYHDGWVDPLTAEAEVGSEQQFVANEVDVNAYGQIMPSFIPDGVGWDSSDWNIASVDSFGLADAVDVGSASIQATWEAPHWWFEATGVCDYLPIIVVLEVPIEARPVVRISSTNATGNIQGTTQKAMLGATIPLHASVVNVNGTQVNTSGGTFSWKLDGNIQGSNSSDLNQVVNSLGSHSISISFTKNKVIATASLTLNVIVPEFEVTQTSSGFLGQENDPDVVNGSNCISLIDPNFYLTLGCPYLQLEYGNGIDITVNLKPAGNYISNADESKVKLVQIVNTYIRRTNASTGECQLISRRGTNDNPWMLDSSDPYGYPERPAVGTILITSQPNIKTSDNPYLRLNNGYNWKLDDKFETYLVYFTGTTQSPQNEKAIGVLEWSWGGETSYISGKEEHVAVAGTLSPTDNIRVLGRSLTATNQGIGIREYDHNTVQSYVNNPANWRICPIQ